MKTLTLAKLSLVCGMLFVSAEIQFAQPPRNPSKVEPKFAAEHELSRKALAAHGGAKFANLRSLVVRGSVDVTSANFPQAIPASFVTIFAGDNYRFEIDSPFQKLKQTYDGTNTVSTAPGGFSLPPINRLGLPLLAKLGTDGYVVTALPAGKKKKTGFRMTSPEGYATDFFVDPKTDQISGYEASYVINARTVTTAVEIDKMKDTDGVKLPEKYVQRFDLGQFTVYASFKAKEILINAELPAGTFAASN